MGLESTITQTSTIVPDTIVNNANTSIALAWDNFDINLETLSAPYIWNMLPEYIRN